ncbi:MAG TPA: M48 family metallopeptidase [Planctomycetes bacterium]|nr:M48 family metallopeptidase [Planctomycetota bacterium]HIK59670.1 M48 family metallopeptidase [Planctomycetota bacterium]
MTGAYDLEQSMDGWVFQRSNPEGRQPARIRMRLDGIVASLEDGTTVQIAWKGMRLNAEPGGEVIYCIAADGAQRIFSEDPDFLRAVEAAGGNDLSDALARMEGMRTSTPLTNRLGCLGCLALTVVLALSVPPLFRWGVNSTVEALPYSVDEIIGEQVWGSMDLGGDEVSDPEVRAAVQAIFDRLTPHSELPEAEFQFKIIDSEVVNAFALPGGYITVFTGLLTEASSPEEVAGVIAHEMAHVTRRHGLRRMAHSVGLWASVTLVLGNTDVLASIARDLFTLASVNGYSQDQETDADLEGVRMLMAAGIDPIGLAHFFEHLAEEHGDVPDSLAWFSTHPQHEERIAAIEEFAASHGGTDEWEPLDVDWDAMLKALD